MYQSTGWHAQGNETIFLEEWEEVLCLMYCLEEDMYHSVLVMNILTGKESISFRF